MVWNVGIDFLQQTVAICDSSTGIWRVKSLEKIMRHFQIPESRLSTLFKSLQTPDRSFPEAMKEVFSKFLDYTDRMYQLILLWISTTPTEIKLGCVCIYMEKTCSYIQSKNLVERGLHYGFEKIQIFNDKKGMECFNVVSLIIELKLLPKLFEGYVIWMFDDSGVTVFKYEGGKLLSIGELAGNDWKLDNQIEQIKNAAQINQNPNAIFYYTLKIPFEKKLVGCVYGNYLPWDDYAEAALVKARIMGNDTELRKFDDINPTLNEKISIYFDDVLYHTILPECLLPIKRCEIIDEHIMTLKINNSLICKLPSYEKAIFLFTVDSNEIFSLKTVDVAEFDENEIVALTSILKTLPEPLIKLDIPKVYTFPKRYESINVDINAIGIDLGSTRCCCAVNRRYAIETIPLDSEKRLLPSNVAFNEPHEKCGQIVVDQLRFQAKSSIFDAKRLIGKKFDSIKVDSSWPFTFKQIIIDEVEPEDSDGVQAIKRTSQYLLKTTECGKVAFKIPEQISAILLKRIKEKAEEFQGKKLSEVVITVPASFNYDQNRATSLAGKLAGFETVHLLPEPVAAAFAYYIDRPIPTFSKMLIFDLGGGTLDVCVYEIANSGLSIRRQSGDPNLGGRDFDNLLINYFQDKLINEHNVDMSNDKKCKLMLKCQSIKETLSMENMTSLNTDEIDPSVETFIPITREEFELMSSGLTARIQKNIFKAIRKDRGYDDTCRNEFEVHRITKVLQVGGGCRMPMIKKLLNDIFPNSEHCCDVNPDEVVAIGAAYYSYHLHLLNKNK